ncbi:MAG: cytidine deaminase [Candidatus Margulisiibacteriota bacterium]|nr:MAG: cytidine deaminase [Candidatus Margulisbacteria bacterium GWD2_39_127]OGI03956.1 MAG: cytidine deaminase [Candidatus Margulisbacteria bacterium GWF2_38_17]OGI08827.1 MAG: cytidine deaminase [Candidatus Margulisbacteria bacterium GWE2_39_32]PZM78670.1 MAG: cytidine deaminase [Candidatus Margulisiibacteriota bacterium]HAR61985.1 cytidine deaminase [Candidatus Margulisiibacteriota bacterium]
MPESIRILTQDISKRPDWDEYFLRIMAVVMQRASCLKRKVGALIVKDNRILASGYNGAPAGIDHCEKVGCLRKELNVPSGQRHELCRGLHAEQNAIVQAAVHGIAIKGATIYCNFLPCIICTKMIINSGIKRVVFTGYYPDDLAVKMFTETDIELDLYQPEKK